MKVGFIGLGTQGKYLAVNLAEAGHDLMVHDLRREPLEALAAVGARVARSAKEVGAHAEVVEICVLNDAQVEEVVAGPEGVLAGAAAGTIIAVHSTIEPATIARLAALAATREVELIDVPVSGSEGGARNKTMSYMVGAARRHSGDAGRCSRPRGRRSRMSGRSAAESARSSRTSSSSASTSSRPMRACGSAPRPASHRTC